MRDHKNSQIKNRKIVDEKLKKLKAIHKKSYEKERYERSKIYQDLKTQLKKDSFDLISNQKVTSESRQKLINLKIKQN